MNLTIPSITIPIIIWLPILFIFAFFILYCTIIGFCYIFEVDIDKWFGNN